MDSRVLFLFFLDHYKTNIQSEYAPIQSADTFSTLDITKISLNTMTTNCEQIRYFRQANDGLRVCQNCCRKAPNTAKYKYNLFAIFFIYV